jgi:chemotaxis signal transduction protein
MSTFVRFRTPNGEYAVAVEHAREVCNASGVLPLPAARPGVAGLLRRGDDSLTVLSVLSPGGNHVLVLDPGEKMFGILVDEVTGVANIDDQAIGPAPDGQQDELVAGVISTPGGLVLLLDAAATARRLSG